MQESIIELKDVTLTRGNVEILKNISLDIVRGKTTLIIGPAGCGKSSLLKTTAGLLNPQKGKVLIQGKDYGDFNEKELLALRKLTGFVFQDSALWANRSVYENIRLPLILHNPNMTKTETADKIQELIRKVGYWDSLQLRPAQVSAGESKLISFARGICNDPEILFLDFPMSGVDSVNAKKLGSLIMAYKAEKKTVIMTTYESADLSQFADQLIVLDKGELIAEGPYPDILSSKNSRLRDIISDVIEKAVEQSEGNDLLDLMNTGD